MLVAPSDHQPRPIRTIAVAYDDGIQAKAALEHAAQLARRLDAHLEIIAGAEHELYAGPAMIAAADLEELMRDDVAERVKAEADAITGVPVDARVVTGPMPSALADAAEGADLLVTGSRGYGPRHSVLVGGVSRYLVDNAPCPVLVVPRVAEGAADHDTSRARRPAACVRDGDDDHEREHRAARPGDWVVARGSATSRPGAGRSSSSSDVRPRALPRALGREHESILYPAEGSASSATAIASADRAAS